MTGSDRKGLVPQHRDRHLFRELGEFLRIVDRVQAKTVAGFQSDSRANRRLHQLTQAGLLRRFRLGTSVAGQKALYSLSKKGALLVDVPYRGLRRRNDEALVADFFVEHQLTVNELYCTLKYQPMPPGIALREWRAFHQPLDPGSRLIPDGYIALQTATQSVAAFLEVDLGHERGPVWREKVRSYLRFAVSGEYERQFAEKRFSVLVMTTTDRRVDSLRATVASVTEKIFWFTTLDAIRSQGLFGKVWLRPKGGDRQAIVRNALLQP